MYILALGLSFSVHLCFVCVSPTRESILGRRARKFDSFTAIVLYICIHAEGQNENKHSSFNGFVSSRSVGMYMYVKMNMLLAVYIKSCLYMHVYRILSSLYQNLHVCIQDI